MTVAEDRTTKAPDPWAVLDDDLRQILSDRVAKMLPGTDPAERWRKMSAKHRDEWVRNERNAPEVAETWKADAERIGGNADPKTVEALRDLPAPVARLHAFPSGEPIEGVALPGSAGVFYRPGPDGEVWRQTEKGRTDVLDWCPIVVEALAAPDDTGGASSRAITIQVGDDAATVMAAEVRDGTVWDRFPGAYGTGTKAVRDILANVVLHLANRCDVVRALSRTGWNAIAGGELVYVTADGRNLASDLSVRLLDVPTATAEAAIPPAGAATPEEMATALRSVAELDKAGKAIALLSLGAGARSLGFSLHETAASLILEGPGGSGKTGCGAVARMLAFDKAWPPQVTATFGDTKTAIEMALAREADVPTLVDDLALQADASPYEMAAARDKIDYLIRPVGNRSDVRRRSSRDLTQRPGHRIRSLPIFSAENLPTAIAASLLRRTVVLVIAHGDVDTRWLARHSRELWAPLRTVGESIVRRLAALGKSEAGEWLRDQDTAWRQAIVAAIGDRPDLVSVEWLVERAAPILTGLVMVERAAGLEPSTLTAPALAALVTHLVVQSQRIDDRMAVAGDIGEALGEVIRAALLDQRAHVCDPHGEPSPVYPVAPQGQGLTRDRGAFGEGQYVGRGAALYGTAHGLAVPPADLLTLLKRSQDQRFAGLGRTRLADVLGRSGALVETTQRGQRWSWKLRLGTGTPPEPRRLLVIRPGLVWDLDADDDPQADPADPGPTPPTDLPTDPTPFPPEEWDALVRDLRAGGTLTAATSARLSPEDWDRLGPVLDSLEPTPPLPVAPAPELETTTPAPITPASGPRDLAELLAPKAMTWRAWAYSHRPTAWLDPYTGQGVTDTGHTFKVGPKRTRKAGMTVAEVLTGLPAEVVRVYLTGPRPGGGSPDQSRAWVLGQLPEGWAPDPMGHYLADPELPVGRFRMGEGKGARRVELHRVGVWGMDDATSPELARQVMSEVDRALHEGFASGSGVAKLEGHGSWLSTPATTGRELARSSVPFDRSADCSARFPVLSDDLAALVRSTSTQGRSQLLDVGPELPALHYLDARFAYAALLAELPIGPGALVDGGTFDPYAPARYEVRATVPDGWDHVGLLGVKDGADGWLWPSTPGERFTTWADPSELNVAQHHGWTFDVVRTLHYAGRAKVLDGWGRALVRARDAIAAHEAKGEIASDVADLARGAVRAILLHGIGAFQASPRKITRTGTDPSKAPAGADRHQVGDRWVWTETMGAAQPELAHPEWSAAIWARCRARLLDSPGPNGTRAGALTLPRDQVVAFRTDAIWTTADPGWPDDGKAGRYRVKTRVEGPIAAPRTIADLLAWGADR